MVTRPSQRNLDTETVDSDGAHELYEGRQHNWLWWLLPIGLLFSAVAAYWGIRHIEKQVVAAAPLILRDAGVDPSGLSFHTEYRNLTVAGQLPEGVSAADVRKILERKRGAAGEDIRSAKIVAYEWIKPEPRDSLADSAVQAVENEDDVSGVAQDAAQIETLPRVGILLGAGTMTLTGADISRAHVDRLLEAASSSVGSENVRQQWQAARLPGAQNALDPDGQDAAQVEALARLVESLGNHATAASITLEKEVISGSIEARSEQSMELLKASSGDGVVVTAAVASEQPVLSIATADDAKIISNVVGVPETNTDASDPIAVENSADQPLRETADESVGSSNDASDDKAAQQGSSEQDAATDINAATDTDAAADTDTSAATDNDVTLRQEISALQLEIDALQQQLQDNVFFVHDSSAITRQAQPILDRVGEAMKQYRRPSVMISGHTDSLSSRSYNLQLSERRAAAVLQYLTINGIDAKRLRSEGFGEDRPVVSNKTLPGRRLNRRVEFTARKPFTEGE